MESIDIETMRKLLARLKVKREEQQLDILELVLLGHAVDYSRLENYDGTIKRLEKAIWEKIG